MLVDAAKSYFLGPVRLAFKLGLIVLVLLLALFAYIALTLDLNPYKPKIEQQASEAVGKPVRITGDLDWGLSWLRPSVVAHDVVVGPVEKPEATMGRLALTVPLSDLMNGSMVKGDLPGRVDLALEKLAYAGQLIGDVTAPVRFGANGLSISPLTVDLPEDGQLVADVDYQGTQLTVTAKAQDVDYGLIIPGATGGDLGGTLELTGKGATIQAVLASLDGEIALRGGKGRLSGDAISLWASDLLSKVMTGTKKHTDVACLLLDGAIRNGVLTPSRAVLDTDDVLVTAKGRIDLVRQRLRLLVTPSPKDAALISLATPLNVEGAWDDPAVTPDKRAVLEKVGGLMLGAVAPPAALLAFGKTGDKSSPCADKQP